MVITTALDKLNATATPIKVRTVTTSNSSQLMIDLLAGKQNLTEVTINSTMHLEGNSSVANTTTATNSTNLKESLINVITLNNVTTGIVNQTLGKTLDNGTLDDEVNALLLSSNLIEINMNGLASAIIGSLNETTAPTSTMNTTNVSLTTLNSGSNSTLPALNSTISHMNCTLNLTETIASRTTRSPTTIIANATRLPFTLLNDTSVYVNTTSPTPSLLNDTIPIAMNTTSNTNTTLI
jgi:hypothetical protein